MYVLYRVAWSRWASEPSPGSRRQRGAAALPGYDKGTTIQHRQESRS